MSSSYEDCYTTTYNIKNGESRVSSKLSFERWHTQWCCPNQELGPLLAPRAVRKANPAERGAWLYDRLSGGLSAMSQVIVDAAETAPQRKPSVVFTAFRVSTPTLVFGPLGCLACGICALTCVRIPVGSQSLLLWERCGTQHTRLPACVSRTLATAQLPHVCARPGPSWSFRRNGVNMKGELVDASLRQRMSMASMTFHDDLRWVILAAWRGVEKVLHERRIIEHHFVKSKILSPCQREKFPSAIQWVAISSIFCVVLVVIFFIFTPIFPVFAFSPTCFWLLRLDSQFSTRHLQCLVFLRELRDLHVGMLDRLHRVFYRTCTSISQDQKNKQYFMGVLKAAAHYLGRGISMNQFGLVDLLDVEIHCS